MSINSISHKSVKRSVNRFLSDEPALVEAMLPNSSEKSHSVQYDFSYLNNKQLTLVHNLAVSKFLTYIQQHNLDYSDEDVECAKNIISDLVENNEEHGISLLEANDDELLYTIKTVMDSLRLDPDFISLYTGTGLPFFTKRHRPPRIKHTNVTASVTNQDCVQDTDINEIIAHFKLTGEFPDVSSAVDVFNCFGSPIQFNEAYEMIEAAGQAFAHIPAEVRHACDNDPAQFIDMLKNPDYSDFLVKYGVLKPLKPSYPSNPTVSPLQPEQSLDSVDKETAGTPQA